MHWEYKTDLLCVAKSLCLIYHLGQFNLFYQPELMCLVGSSFWHFSWKHKWPHFGNHGEREKEFCLIGYTLVKGFVSFHYSLSRLEMIWADSCSDNVIFWHFEINETNRESSSLLLLMWQNMFASIAHKRPRWAFNGGKCSPNKSLCVTTICSYRKI